MRNLSLAVGRTLYAFVVSLFTLCLPCGETLVPLLLQGARSLSGRFPSPPAGA